MVTVYIGAGLANRMFQYAFALKLKSLGYNVDIDEHTFKPRYNFEGLNLRDVFENIDLKESCPSKFKYAINDLISILILIVSAFFCIPVFYVFFNQIKGIFIKENNYD